MSKFWRGNLSKVGRILFVVAALMLVACLFFPWWTLLLEATIYPEGLRMEVYANKIGGRIDIINNLNHYIGMKEIDEADFPEIQYMAYIVGFIVLLALLTAWRGKVWLGTTTFGLAAIGGCLGIYRLWFWLRKYGTDLDPMAAITIPPFVPPMIGKNQLANFTTYTGFGLGGYLLGVGIFLMLIALWRFRQWEKQEPSES